MKNFLLMKTDKERITKALYVEIADRKRDMMVMATVVMLVLVMFVMLVSDEGSRTGVHSGREIDEGKCQGSERKIFFQSGLSLSVNCFRLFSGGRYKCKVALFFVWLRTMQGEFP